MEKSKLEVLAEFVHAEMWEKWAKEVINTEPNISEERRERWEGCFVPYSELSEGMKDLDRGFAKRILDILDDNVTK